jgi:hypothetical protein
MLGVARARLRRVRTTSAGQGLRAVPQHLTPRGRASSLLRGEFDSLDVILREYARRSPHRARRWWRRRARWTLRDTGDIVAAIGARSRSRS